MLNVFKSKLLNANSLLERAGIMERMIVADLGCGTSGHFTFEAAKMVGEKGLVYAVDVRPSVLDSIKSNAQLKGMENIRSIRADLEKYGSTKIKDSFVDMVLLVNVLFQSRKYYEVIREANRILKKRGKFLVVDWKKTNIALGPPIDYRVDQNDVQAIFVSLGAELLENFEAGPYHFGMIFEKK